ncbi:MAG: hypothetical protein FJY07_03690 [Bacteroidetes bacterium]|nr:hypothetical protein [Bacteroidota bacterium]
MKKPVAVILSIVLFGLASYAQKLTATLSIDNVDISGLKAGDEISVPVRLVKKTSEKLLGFQLFVNFDHKLLMWPANIDDPAKGVKGISEEIPYSGGGWMFNDNGNQFVALWNDPSLLGKEVPSNMILFEMVFIYQGGLMKGTNTVFSWGQTYEIVDDKLAKGPTEMYDENGDQYALTLTEGGLTNR